MSILTIVIFISYRLINDVNFMFGRQLNTTKSQLSVNDLSKYLSRDIQYSINIEGPIFSKNKSDGSEYKLNNIDNSDEVNYEYKITTNENKELVYLVSIKDGKYSIYRKDYNGVSLDFIANDKLVEDGNNLKAPLVIKQISDNKLIYTVNLQSTDKKNDEYSFQVASRYQSGTISGDIDLGNSGNGVSTEKPDELEGTISNKNLEFQYKKLYKLSYSEDYNWEHKVIFNLDEIKPNEGEKPNGNKFLDEFAIRRYGETMNAYTSSWCSANVEITNSKVKEIKGFRLKFKDGIIIKNIKFMGKDYSEELNDSKKVYTFKLDENTQNVEYGNLLTGNVEIEENSKIGDTYTIEIEFIY